MYSDLFDALGRQHQRQHQQQQPLSPPPILTCKAGKLDLTLQENGKYYVTPDLRRGEIQLVWKDDVSQLYWEWFDRRDKTTVDSFPLETGSASTFERVDTGREQDRVYLWKQNDNYYMYWLQEGTTSELDDEIVAQINQYLANPTEAAPATSHRSATATSTTAPLSSASPSQVDALSNILENLGMLQQQQQLQEDTTATADASNNNTNNAGATAPSATSAATPAARVNNRSIAGTPTGRLTLADLQGAMAALQQLTTAVTLQDVVTSDAVNTLLQDEAVQRRLLELLPEEQRSLELLQDNLRSPQLQQTLRSLTAAVQADPDTGSLDGYHSLVANFSLPQAEQALVANAGNPVAAFLDCILASVQQGEETKEEEKAGEESKEPENDDKNGGGSLDE